MAEGRAKRALLQKSLKKGQGRKASWRKERGCDASPFRSTFAGNADKIKVFEQLALKFEKGLQIGKSQKKGVAERKNLYFTRKKQGLCFLFDYFCKDDILVITRKQRRAQDAAD